jgi:hypothetical protein
MAKTGRHAPLSTESGILEKGVVLMRGKGLLMPSALGISLKKSSGPASSGSCQEPWWFISASPEHRSSYFRFQ